MTLQEALRHFDGVKRCNNNQYMARCPCHDDRKQSLSIGGGEKGVVLKCHAGCDTRDIIDCVGLKPSDLFYEQRSKAQKRPKKIVKIYEYPNGVQKVRFDNKDFMWRRPDGKGGWIWDRKGIKPSLYIAADNLTGIVAVAEGEKDADTLHRLGWDAVSSENGAGRGKWQREYTEQLKGCSVYIFQDNDKVGKAYALETAGALYGSAESVRLLDLSQVWPEIPEHGDVSDMVNELGDDEASNRLVELMRNSPEWIPPSTESHSIIEEFQAGENVKPEDFSDAGNAEVFVRLHSKDLLYTDSLGWHCWNGKLWERNNHKALALSTELSRQMLEEANKEYSAALHRTADAKAQYEKTGESEDQIALEKAKRAEQYAKAYNDHAKKFRQAPAIKNTVTLAVPYLTVKADMLDANPFDLNTPVGIVDLKTGTIRPHDQEAYCSKVTKVSPGGQGVDMWTHFLETIACGDSDLIDYLQMVAGMSLIGEVYHEGIILAHGEGRNGKSTYFNALAEVLGDYAGSIDINVITTTQEKRGPALATLRGRRLVVTGELEEHQHLSTATLKRIASTDKLVIEEKYRQPEEIKPSHTLVLFTNHLPRVNSTDNGTWRRLSVVPFNAVIPPDKGIQNYANTLVKEAGGAILTWAIEGAVKFTRNDFKLTPPDSVIQATREYQHNENWLYNFLEECCIIDSSGRVGASELYQEYQAWAQRAGSMKRGPRYFDAAMRTEGFKKITPKNKKPG